MLKKRMSIVSVAVLAAVALGAALTLTSCKSATPVSQTPAATTGAATSPTSSATSSSPSSTIPSSSAVVTPGTTAPGTVDPGTGQAPSTPDSNGSNPSLTVTTLKPFKKMPASKLAAVNLTSPAKAGKKLAPLTAAPDPTISALKLGTLPEGASYTVQMRPYGIGPDLVLGSRLVIHLDSVTPRGSSPKNSAIENTNVLALIDTNNGGAITKGGTYTARLTFRSDGNKMLPILSLAKLK